MDKPFICFIRRYTLLGGALLLLLPPPLSSQTVARIAFASQVSHSQTLQPLGEALDELKAHYRIDLIYTDRLVAGHKVASISYGRFQSAEMALQELLKNLDLRFQKVKDKTYIIRRSRPVKKQNPAETPAHEENERSQADFTAVPLAGLTPTTSAFGEDQPIRGQVVAAETNDPLVGVSVLVKGTTRGVNTDADGRFQLALPAVPATLIFSYVGYERQEINITSQTNIDVVLKPDQRSLEEVVVVGYGTQKKTNLTGAVATVSSEDLIRRPVGQTSTALQGMMPGVTVTQRSGRPGGDAGTIRVRGVGTLGGGQDPLVLIDGIEGSMNNIDPNLIETVTVLKDAASSSIYGSRAANGVVLITTKRAKGGKLSVNYNNYFGWQSPTNLPHMVNAVDHMLLTNEAYVNVGRAPLYSDDLIQKYRTEGASNRDLYPDTDWQKAVLTGSGFQQSHFLTVKGGTEKFRFLTSLGYLNQNGIIQNSSFTRYTLRNNMDMQFSKKLSARADIQLVAPTTIEPGRSSDEVFHWMNRIPANQIGINSNGTWGDGWNGDNPIAFSRAGGQMKNNSPYVLINAALVYKPVDWITAEVAYAPKYALSIDKNFNRNIQTYKPNGALSFLAPAKSTLTEGTSRSFYNTLRGTVTLDRTFGDHGVKVLAGFSREDFRNDYVTAYREGFLLPDYNVLNAGAADIQRNTGGASEWALQSFFGRINYDYKQKYLFEANARYDGSSRFVKGQRYGFFPSFSAGWRVSQENFMQPLSGVVNELKLRASWGQLGNQNIGTYPFISSLNFGSYALGKQIVNVVALNTLANTNITWERTEMSDIGLDLTLFSRLSLTADYYLKRTKDILLTLDIPAIIGLGAPNQNAGVVDNKGWELGLTYRGKARDFRYDIGFNISDVRNKIIDMRGVNLTGVTVNREGYPISSIYGLQAEGYFQSDDEVAAHAQQFGTIKPGDLKYKDQNGDGIINADDYVVIGSTVPRFTFGSTINLAYKGFGLNVVLQGVGKADGLLYEQGIMPFFLGGTVQEQHKNHWTPENRNAAFPRLAFSESNNEKISSFWMKNAAYLRLKNVQFSYTLPQALTQRAGISSLRLFANGQNIWTLDRFWNGYDVESPVGTGRTYPQVKMFSFGVDASF
ncbi:SusC/RagA family TonB-linked outer membrane protein [Siphonobacter aquaeclarae]|uniref:TonB-linked outer membrane protein, SusC/RagA family n=1 Tax=Siphonobacter aquaeclarae TaxID=563176 RepID=A0A1G9VDZ9_9BACT|nr:SusC/RagA family TonB-linked outer membrane protein [Siphonobacter aquaeclarae]SDM70326.1 TonB-linked outer membrane protein, SusC/RagA family [Siphonobacter aquaeclarae]